MPQVIGGGSRPIRRPPRLGITRPLHRFRLSRAEHGTRSGPRAAAKTEATDSVRRRLAGGRSRGQGGAPLRGQREQPVAGRTTEKPMTGLHNLIM